MKAITYYQYGSPDVLKLEEVDKPVPLEDEVLIKVYAAGMNAADWHFMRATPFPIRFVSGLTKPKLHILGADVAGRIEAIGKNVKQFKVGDDVFGDLSGCGFGAFAEYACAREDAVALKPANLSFEEAAAVPLAAVTALQGLRYKGNICPGQKVLINGASGGVGTYAVQLAKFFGTEVTAVCSTSKITLARTNGADNVIDYTQNDFTKSGKRYDLILAANGDRSIWDYKRVLSPGGTYVMTGGEGSQLFQAMAIGPFIRGNKMTNLLARPSQTDLYFLKDVIEAGKLRPVIDRRYPLSQLAEAMRYLEAGHASGKIVIPMDM
jgi:NADPH:quinone reductase-like Zn-dependent oxidoreductase